MSKGLVSIILVTRNSQATLPACLSSIQAQTYDNYEIILVDNASTDQTVSCISSQKVHLLTNPSNLGFARANNQAFAVSKGEFILFLNADAGIDKNFLARAIPYFNEDRSLGSISAKIIRPPDGDTRIIDSAGLLMANWRLLPQDRGEGEVDRGQYDRAAQIFGTPGACALYRRSALETAAFGQEIMDEDFFAYYEDVDLAWRVRLQNWTALYIPEAVAYHQKRGPQGKESFIQVKAFTNRYWCYVKNARAADFLLYAPIAVAYEILRVFKVLTLRPSWIRAYFNEWRLLARMIKKRRGMRDTQRLGHSD